VEKGDLRRTSVGSGPLILQEWVPQSHLKARKNPDYWDKGKPAVDADEIKVIPDEANIIVQLRTGNIHHALLEDNKNYLLVKDDKRLKAIRAPRLGFDMVNINHGRKPFQDSRDRQALGLGVDAQIIQEEYGVWIKAIIKPNFDFDLTMNITSGDADPDSLLYRRFHSSEKQWNNDGDPDVDVLLDQGRVALDPKKRKEIYDQAQRLMIERATQIWTFAPDM